jgi:stress-induced morphogen
MAVNVLGADAVTEAFAKQLESYAAAHPDAVVDVYRQGAVSVRVRVVDPRFRGMSRNERHKAVWPLLYALDQETLDELGMLLLIAPDERESSPVNREFETGRFAKAFPKAIQATPGDGGAKA